MTTLPKIFKPITQTTVTVVVFLFGLEVLANFIKPK